MEHRLLEECAEYIEYRTGPEVPLPGEVTMELTSRCNLHCRMCPRAQGHPRTEPEQTMSPELLDRLLTRVIPELFRLNVVGDGEAMLEPELLRRLLEGAGERGVPVTLCTNGTLLGGELGRYLVEVGLADLSISLDAASPETYQSIRGGSLEEVLENIRAIQEQKKLQKRGLPRLHASMVAMRRNIEELPDLVRLAARLGLESVTVQAMGERVRELEGESAFQWDPHAARQLVASALDRADGCGVRLKVLPEIFREEALRGVVPQEDDRPLYKACDLPWTAPFITATGDVRPCCADHPVMGNLMELDLAEIWHGQDYRELRRALLTTEPPEVCLRCPGTGWRRGTPIPSLLTPQEEHPGFAGGFYPAEGEVPAFRWTRERATAFLDSRGAETILLEHRAGDLEGLPRQGMLRAGAKGTEPVPSQPDHWRITELSGGPWPEPLVRVDLEVPEAARPVRLDPELKDARRLGLMVRRLEARRWETRAVLGGVVAFLGAELPETIQAGNGQECRLFFRCLERMDQEYQILVHCVQRPESAGLLHRIRSGTRGIAFQADHPPLEGEMPTTRWQKGEIFIDRFELRAPPDRTGEYEVRIGLYVPEQRHRLPVMDANVTSGRGWVTAGVIRLHPPYSGE